MPNAPNTPEPTPLPAGTFAGVVFGLTAGFGPEIVLHADRLNSAMKSAIGATTGFMVIPI
ncbi:hypothetical protein PPNSA23_13510 [Phyllobacterium phragmitis]|uniref:Uncharacterized protein n=1 Tax=Phyllobacterium phragmitis TaxID=2670329 RepID=A0ABQ0GXN5_9HYPH